MIIFAVIIVPGLIGFTGANNALARDIPLYDKGCDHSSTPENQCHVIMDGAKVITSGFLISASDTRVAIYQDQKIRIIPIKDYSIESLPPKDYLALIAAKKTQIPPDTLSPTLKP